MYLLSESIWGQNLVTMLLLDLQENLLTYLLSCVYMWVCYFCRAIKKTVKGFPRPFMDMTASNFGKIIENAIGRKLEPQFDPYANSLNFLIACYIIPYVGLTGYVGANPKLQSPQSKSVRPYSTIFLFSLLNFYINYIH